MAVLSIVIKVRDNYDPDTFKLEDQVTIDSPTLVLSGAYAVKRIHRDFSNPDYAEIDLNKRRIEEWEFDQATQQQLGTIASTPITVGAPQPVTAKAVDAYDVSVIGVHEAPAFNPTVIDAVTAAKVATTIVVGSPSSGGGGGGENKGSGSRGTSGSGEKAPGTTNDARAGGTGGGGGGNVSEHVQ